MTTIFQGADIVYLMETLDAAVKMFDTSIDFIGTIPMSGENYKKAIKRNGIKRVVHLGSIGTPMAEDNGMLT